MATQRFIDLSGKTFGMLAVVGRATNNGCGSARWLVTCSCSGKQVVVSASNLRSGKTKSCGCQKGTKPPKQVCSQGHAFTPENTVTKLTDGRRRCRQCVNAKASELQRKWRRANPEAAREKELMKKYGISQAEKDAILHAQGDRCAACGSTEPKGRHNVWCLDHCHKTGKIRGVLCTPCNIALGVVDEDVDRLLGLVSYLNEHAPVNFSDSIMPLSSS